MSKQVREWKEMTLESQGPRRTLWAMVRTQAFILNERGGHRILNGCKTQFRYFEKIVLAAMWKTDCREIRAYGKRLDRKLN